ncbi:MAG: UDP-N-acetylglucosamine 2-epimerase [Actinobacteria bacterium]|nr:UDP-N-acetylglucosamine 2-epimerase [Actinomycetota bacterium]
MEKLMVVIGTKGQYVKMAPVLLEMDRRGIPYVLVHANQHPLITREISDTFGLRPPDMELWGLRKDIAKSTEALSWLAGNLLLALRGTLKDGSEIRRIKDLLAKDALVVIHGDAPPALLSLILAKRFHLRIAHVESGERTHNLLSPFPEEIIRRLVDRYSDLLFAGSQNALENLKRERVQGRIIDIGMNTVLDAVRFVLKNRKHDVPFVPHEYVLVSLHRFELTNSRSRLSFILELLESRLATEKLVMTMHESTRWGLQRAGLLDRLTGLPHMNILPLLPYHEFIHLMAQAKFLVTDGGGPQQESYLLGVPCIVIRESVEQEGFPNVCVSGFDPSRVREFLLRLDDYRLPEGIGRFDHVHPSRTVVDHIEKAV